MYCVIAIMFKMLNMKTSREYTNMLKQLLPHFIQQSCYNDYAHSTDKEAEWLRLESGIRSGLVQFFTLLFIYSIILNPVFTPRGGRQGPEGKIQRSSLRLKGIPSVQRHSLPSVTDLWGSEDTGEHWASLRVWSLENLERPSCGCSCL